MRLQVAAAILFLAIAQAAAPIARAPRKIMVWPVVVPAVTKGDVRLCPVCGVAITNAVIEPGGAVVFQAELAARLKGLKGCELMFPQQPEMKKDEEKDEISLAMKAASARGADELLIPVLLRYRERRGKAYAASETASVAFNLFLVDTGESNIRWKFMYNETQQPLSENLVKIKKFFKRKARFVKAGQLLAEGLEQAMKKFPECGETAQ